MSSHVFKTTIFQISSWILFWKGYQINSYKFEFEFYVKTEIKFINVYTDYKKNCWIKVL